MFDLSSGALAVLLIVMGVAFLGLTFILLRLTPKIQPLPRVTPPAPISEKVAAHSEAVLLIQHGGRVAYLNQAARDLFNVWEDEPSLESLARRTRPSEVFLSLCASEGQARFTLNGRFIEATSYYSTLATQTDLTHSAILISLRRPQLVLDSSGIVASSQSATAGAEGSPIEHSLDVSTQALSTITELSQAMTCSLELNETIQTILESVERLIPSDILELNVWEGEARLLVPYRLVGIPGLDRRLERGAERYSENQGYTGYLARTREALLVKDITTFRQVRPALDRQRYPFQSYIGVPLVMAGDLIGTLELASLTRNHYTENDLEILRLLSGQAAVAVNNALLYEQQQQRALELAGLARLAQTVSSIRDPQDLVAQLVEQISPMLDVEILGFLLYDENRRLLQAQNPFLGIPPNIVEWYQISIPADSPAEAVFLSSETILAPNAPEDPTLKTLEMHHVAMVGSIQNTALLPLTSGGRMLGYLQVGDKRDGSLFDKDDMRFLAIIAGQAAPILENASLVQQARKRTQRAETLRRIASLISSTATIDEVLKFSLMDLARLLQADLAGILFVDENRGELVFHRDSLYGLPAELAKTIGGISQDSPGFQLTVTHLKRQLMSPDLAEDPDIPALYHPLAEKLGMHSFISVPLVVRERGLGELILGSLRPNFFSSADVQGVATAASQLAAAMEQSALAAQTDESLREQVETLTSLTRVSRQLGAKQDLDLLLQQVYEEALRLGNADCGTVIFFKRGVPSNDNQSQEVIQTGDLPTLDRAQWKVVGEDPAAALGEPELQALKTSDPLIVQDYPSPAPNVNLGPWQAPHPGVRSALIIPITYQGRTVGLIHLHARHPAHFGELQRQSCQALAIQAAIALDNLARFQAQEQASRQLTQRATALARLVEVTRSIETEERLEKALENLAAAAQAATPFSQVAVCKVEPQEGLIVPVASAGEPSPKLSGFQASRPRWDDFIRSIPPGQPQRQAFLFSGETIEPLAGLAAGEAPALLAANGHAPWQPEDLLVIPVYSSSQEPLGLLAFDAPRDGLRPEAEWAETLSALSDQAALIITNYQKIGQLQRQVASTQEDMQLALEAAQKAQRHLPNLLHKDLQQTLALSQMGQRMRRLIAGLEIAGLINQKASREAIYAALGQEILKRMEFDSVVIAENVSGRLDILEVLGSIPGGANPQALLGQRNPIRHSLQTGEILLVANLTEDPDWEASPLLRALEARGFICLPVASSIVGSKSTARPERDLLSRAAVLAISQSPLAPFSAEDMQLFELLLQQVTIALQNQDLVDETIQRLSEINLLMEFSRRLGSLDLGSVLNNLLESAMRVAPAAQMGMVALWDARQGVVAPQIASGYADPGALLQVHYHPGEGLPGQVYEKRYPLRLDVVDFAVHYNLSAENLLRYRNATAGRLPVSSLAIPILAGSGQQVALPIPPTDQDESTIGRGRFLGVLVLDNNQATSAFTEDDVRLLTSLAQQTALMLENISLYQASEQRSSQLQALTHASSTITSSLQTQNLIPTLLDQLRAIVAYDTGILWLREKGIALRPGQPSTDRLVIRAAQGFDDSEQRLGLAVDVQDSALLLEMIQTGQPIWVPNIAQDSRFHTVGMDVYERLSWLGVPLISSGDVLGVIALEKAEPGFYTADDIQVAMTFAGQAAAGMQNARLYQESVQRAAELDQRTQTLTILNRLSSELSGSLDAGEILRPALQEFAEIITCTSVSALLFDYESDINWSMNESGAIEQSSSQLIVRAEYPAYNLDSRSKFSIGASLPIIPLLERLRETQGIFSSDDIEAESEIAPWKDYLARHYSRSVLILPILSGTTSTDPLLPERFFHGVLIAHHEENYRFKVEELELARTITNQLAISLQNARLYEETRRLTSDLEVRVLERTAELGREHRRSETLLRIITELAASLDLDQVLHSTLQVLNEFVDAEQIFILIARPGEQNLVRLASLAYTPEIASMQESISFDVNLGLAGWIISQRKSLLTEDMHADFQWQSLAKTASEHELLREYHSVMGVPLMSGAEALGCLLLLHSANSHFSIDQLDLVQAAANQVAVAVNNAELYQLIRDQAEDLGTMLRNQQIETSRTKAILEAVADGVLVTGAERTITLFNESAEKILGLSRLQVVGKSMEHFAGLFGRATHQWLQTIDIWSRDPSSYQAGDVFTEQILLEDGRVILVRLAPVILRTDFLGTVSIFQDITHQVEVDRLKSEFVATVSHELRTPMTSIKGYVEILLLGAAGVLSEQQAHFLQIVKSNTERLAILVNDLLDISQIESGRVVLSLQPLDLEELVEEAVVQLKRSIEDDGKLIAVEKQIESNLPPVKGDSERLRTILSNLLDNAYQYNTPNGKIQVRVKRVNDEIQVDIQDNGLGIHPADLDRVFERFYRGENPLVLGVSGTGLGLSIVKNLVEMHKGRIWCESKGVSGEGSTFSFTLPVYSPEAA